MHNANVIKLNSDLLNSRGFFCGCFGYNKKILIVKTHLISAKKTNRGNIKPRFVFLIAVFTFYEGSVSENHLPFLPW